MRSAAMRPKRVQCSIRPSIQISSTSVSALRCTAMRPLPACSSGDRWLIADLRQQRSEEHTSELQSLMRISYAVFCLKKKKTNKNQNTQQSLVNTQYKHLAN